MSNIHDTVPITGTRPEERISAAVTHYDRGMAAFEALFVPSGLRAAVSGRAWLEGMLASERALVRAATAAGLVPAAAAV